MDTSEKLDILSRDAQYDLSCACGTKQGTDRRKRTSTGDSWLYPVTVASGGTGIMLKTLMGNGCSNDCKYCPLRDNQDFRRVALTPDETARFFMDLQRKKGLIGIFLSSAVTANPDCTMDRLLTTAYLLRKKYRYRGYIHLKIIPGCSVEAIDMALRLASAVSLNIETPSAKHFKVLTDRKDFRKDIVSPLKYIGQMTQRGSEFSRVGFTSQFIVGASDETDSEILSCSDAMYSSLGIERLYFSAYQRGLGDPSIPGENKPIVYEENWLFDNIPKVDTDHLTREHRLYQADFLFRQYGFTYKDMTFSDKGNLDLLKDPKQVWADNHPEFFPLLLQKASKSQLLRVPGIGPVTAKEIMKTKKNGFALRADSLPEKAKPYLICS